MPRVQQTSGEPGMEVRGQLRRLTRTIQERGNENRDATGAPVIENKHIIGEVEASMNVTSFETFETKDAVAAYATSGRRRCRCLRSLCGSLTSCGPRTYEGGT